MHELEIILPLLATSVLVIAFFARHAHRRDREEELDAHFNKQLGSLE